MIRSFADRDTRYLFQRESVGKFHAFERTARRRLFLLNSAESLSDFKGNGLSLEALRGNRKGQHSIRINAQWRVCFIWRDGDAFEVEVCDYH